MKSRKNDAEIILDLNVKTERLAKILDEDGKINQDNAVESLLTQKKKLLNKNLLDVKLLK